MTINRRDIYSGIAILAVLFLIFVISAAILSSFSLDGIPLREKTIGIIELTGPIVAPDKVVKSLERCIENKNIPVIVIRLNTPGGGVSATQEIFETVKKARLKGKKVVASMGTVAASGGYYIAAACDSIVATPGTITGSIGVIATFADFSVLYKKIGIDFEVVKTGKFKDMGSSSRKMTEEEKALMDSLIMDTYDQFLSAVSEGRKLDKNYVKTLADGRVFTGRQAQKNKLVDILGTYQDAVDLAGTMAGIGKNPPVYKEDGGIIGNFLDEASSKILLKGLDFNLPRMLYMLSY